MFKAKVFFHEYTYQKFSFRNAKFLTNWVYASQEQIQLMLYLLTY